MFRTKPKLLITHKYIKITRPFLIYHMKDQHQETQTTYPSLQRKSPQGMVIMKKTKLTN